MMLFPGIKATSNFFSSSICGHALQRRGRPQAVWIDLGIPDLLALCVNTNSILMSVKPYSKSIRKPGFVTHILAMQSGTGLAPIQKSMISTAFTTPFLTDAKHDTRNHSVSKYFIPVLSPRIMCVVEPRYKSAGPRDPPNHPSYRTLAHRTKTDQNWEVPRDIKPTETSSLSIQPFTAQQVLL